MRPPASVRIGVLVAAVACLGLAMCARSERAKPTTPANAQHAAPQAVQRPQAAKPAENPPPTYFPATKAAGPIYR